MVATSHRTREIVRSEELERQIAEAVAFVRANPDRQVLVSCGHVKSWAQLEAGLREGLTLREFDQVRIEWAPVLGE